MRKRVFILLAITAGVLPFFGFIKPTEEAPVDVPIVMYHSVTNINCNDYALSPEKLRADLDYLSAHGYRTVFIRDVVAYVEGKGDLPEKPIVLSFDDGFYNNYSSVLPILNEYDAVAVFCLVGKYAAKEQGATKRSKSYSYMNLDEVRAMNESGRAEFGNHTFDMHSYKNGRKGVRKNKNESEEEYRKAISDDARRNEELFSQSGIRFGLYAYPYGFYSKETPGILSSLGYKAILTCTGGINRIRRGDKSALLHLKRYNRPSKYTSEYFFKNVFKLDDAPAKKACAKIKITEV